MSSALPFVCAISPVLLVPSPFVKRLSFRLVTVMLMLIEITSVLSASFVNGIITVRSTAVVTAADWSHCSTFD